jgi:hypothetical protein
MNKKKSGCLIILLIVLLVAIAYWWRATQAHVYKSSISPDGSWSVTVLRKHTAPPPFEGVDVIVRVNDSDGTIILEETIDNRDLWNDVESRYPDVICENNQIRIGPKWWNGIEFDYYRLNKKDFEPVN